MRAPVLRGVHEPSTATCGASTTRPAVSPGCLIARSALDATSSTRRVPASPRTGKQPQERATSRACKLKLARRTSTEGRGGRTSVRLGGPHQGACCAVTAGDPAGRPRRALPVQRSSSPRCRGLGSYGHGARRQRNWEAAASRSGL
ncbi:hypothetical protein FA95DRAFT_1216953 [Auriscalpium vulgare]|uniref:Uncharacterized protein n=1 Tax=Auriscalpium vulgare TaxID=40419 RepID=A0ACB8R363_9AGAM|nr:hypothetical protein FA95DRAFT_1216953 [Auriscalpium vulgare]